MEGMREMVTGGNVNARKLELVQAGEGAVGPVLAPDGLAEFSRMLSVFTHCSKLKVLPRSSPYDPNGKALLSFIWSCM